MCFNIFGLKQVKVDYTYSSVEFFPVIHLTNPLPALSRSASRLFLPIMVRGLYSRSRCSPTTQGRNRIWFCLCRKSQNRGLYVCMRVVLPAVAHLLIGWTWVKSEANVFRFPTMTLILSHQDYNRKFTTELEEHIIRFLDCLSAASIKKCLCSSIYCLLKSIEYLIYNFIFYFMSRSVASNASSKMLQEIANKSQTKIYRVQGSFNDEEMRVIWNSLGLYVSRNLRMGRGVNIPKFGIFTFTPPEVRLKGVTNQQQRDQQPRTPVFLIQKDFVKGVNLRTAIFYHQEFGAGLRPYSALGATGQVPIAKLNLTEVASYANMSKDECELGLNRIIKYISEKLYSGQDLTLQIPSLGQFISRNQLVAVKFNEFLQRDTRNVLARSVDERKLRGNMSLTADNLKKFSNLADMSAKLAGKTQDFFEIDENARRYLQSGFGLHIDDSNMKRSVTGFDRSVATRLFDRTNKSLRESNGFKRAQSGLSRSNGFNKQFNLALKIIRSWVNDNEYNSQQGFGVFCQLAGKKVGVLNESELWQGCKGVSIDITQQQAHELFRILDSNKDGLITIDDWKVNIKFDHNNTKFSKLLEYIKEKGLSQAKIVSILGLQGVRRVNLFKLKQGLIKLWVGVSQEDALLLSKHITKGKEQIQIEQLIDLFSFKAEDRPVHVDSEWQNRFLARLKTKINEQPVTEQQLTSKFRFYDQQDTGFIEQTDFKTVLNELGISLSFTELIKLVRFVPLNGKNHVDYNYVLRKLADVDYESRKELTQSEFIRVIREVLKQQPFQLPISVTKLTSLLQARNFKAYSEKQVLRFVRQLDLNEDEQVTQQDLKGYRQVTRDLREAALSSLKAEELLIRLRERTIKRKISYYDLFRKLDKVGSGFITREGWLSDIDQVISYTQEEKQGLFDFIDQSKARVIDYKTFLSAMNGNKNGDTEKFDWAEQALAKIKQWFSTSGLTVQDAFRVLDRDGDTYISQKDLHLFLVEKLKYQQRQLSIVRLQKLIKLMDSYKRGRISFLDWHRIINSSKDWLSDAHQQIGLVLSRLYSSLSEAFTTITQGDKKLLFAAFDRWVRSSYALSGFMVNEDMLKAVFGYLDKQKKGYLLQNDFVALFGSYDWKAAHTQQFLHFLALKFKTVEEAHKYMTDYGQSPLNFDRFGKVLKQFFADRFQESDAVDIWKNLSGGKMVVDLVQLRRLHGHLWSSNYNAVEHQFPKDSWKYQDFNIIKGTTIRSKEYAYAEREKMEDQCNKFINNLRDIVASSHKSLEQAFLDVDKENTGRVTNLAFKKALRGLNIALTSKQIDLLLNYCELKGETLIDWRQFIRQLSLQQNKQQLKSRLQPRLQHVSDLLHYYMISPKDAFRKWNNPRTGYLNFEQFHNMLKQLYTQADQPFPEYQQIEDLFAYIDLRKDQQLDFQQFTQVFRNCNPPSLLMGTTPSTTAARTASKNKQSTKPVREQSIPLFRHSPDYQNFVKLIGRNRKYLQQQIEKTNEHKTAFIPFETVEKLISGFAAKHGAKVDAQMVRNLIAFSMTGDKVDYHLLVAKFKDLSVQISEFPKQKVF